MGVNNAFIPIFVKEHKSCNSFATIDSYSKNSVLHQLIYAAELPWEPKNDSWGNNWGEWRCSVYHPRSLIDDFNIYDWNVVVNFILPKYAYIHLMSDVIPLIRREYHRLLRIRLAESRFKFVYTFSVPHLYLIYK